MEKTNIEKLVEDGILTAILIILGMLKLPSIIPGTEFQLSAPYAVCVAVLVGFGRYLRIGICASFIQLLLGTHTIWNVTIAMIFRIVAGGIIALFPNKKILLYIAGPLGTAAARMVMAVVLGVPLIPLLVSAAPGMLFTVVGVAVILPIMKRIIKNAPAVHLDHR